MTVRKECRPVGRTCWSVYRRQGQRPRKRYRGVSAVLTDNRLQQIAARLRNRRRWRTALSVSPTVGFYRIQWLAL